MEQKTSGRLYRTVENRSRRTRERSSAYADRPETVSCSAPVRGVRFPRSHRTPRGRGKRDGAPKLRIVESDQTRCRWCCRRHCPGKSTRARLLAAGDGVVIDADEVVRELQDHPNVIEEMERILGSPLRNPDGTPRPRARGGCGIRRSGQAARARGVPPPLALRRIDELVGEAVASEGAPPAAARRPDVPLLFESGLDRRCDRIVFIESQESDRAARAAAERGWDADEGGAARIPPMEPRGKTGAIAARPAQHGEPSGAFRRGRPRAPRDPSRR
mgnify:CR=1 FL=1